MLYTYFLKIQTLLFIAFCFYVITFQVHAANNQAKNTLTVQVFNAQKKPLKNVVVFIEPVGHNIDKINTNTLEIGQNNKAFVPYISVMQLGSDVRFNNKDNITHQIYSPVGNNKFSLKIRSGEKFIKTDFNEAGEVSMGCNIHDWMTGYLLIVDTPYFAISNTSGNTEIQIEQSGQYKVVVWHPQINEENNRISKIINVNRDMNVSMQLLTPMGVIPTQENEDDFDFLSDY